jgi:uncharacterized protein (TIGR00369 family)
MSQSGQALVASLNAPAGFELFDIRGHYDQAFGPLFIDRAGSRLGFRVTERHLNPNGICHGGALAMFADMQVVTVGPGPAGQYSPTINLSIDYLAPAPLGAWVEAHVIPLKTTRSLIFSQAVMTVDGDPVARATAIYRRIHDPVPVRT